MKTLVSSGSNCEPEQRTPRFFIRVIDENEEPLDDEGYAIYLGYRILVGILLGSYILEIQK